MIFKTKDVNIGPLHHMHLCALTHTHECICIYMYIFHTNMQNRISKGVREQAQQLMSAIMKTRA